MSKRRFIDHWSGFTCTLRKCAYPSVRAASLVILARVRR